jgi:hypothetical protein
LAKSCTLPKGESGCDEAQIQLLLSIRHHLIVQQGPGTKPLDVLANHVTIFSEKWPLRICMNGYLMLNGQKMLKSNLGNSLTQTLREGIEKVGADAMRLSLPVADAGDGIKVANFDEKTADANILRVPTLLGWCELHILLYISLVIYRCKLSGYVERRIQVEERPQRLP